MPEDKTLIELRHAAKQISEADDLLKKNTGNPSVSTYAAGLALAAIAKVLLVRTADKYQLLGSL